MADSSIRSGAVRHTCMKRRGNHLDAFCSSFLAHYLSADKDATLIPAAFPRIASSPSFGMINTAYPFRA